MAEQTHRERGRTLGLFVKKNHETGGNYDVRWDLATEARSLTRENFAEFKAGLESAWEDDDA